MKIQYIRVGDYYIQDLTLPEEPRPTYQCLTGRIVS